MDFEDTINSTELPWQQNSYVTVELSGRASVRILANKEGLLSLASHLEALANNTQASILYEDTPGDLESGSVTLEIQKVSHVGKFNYCHAFELRQEHSFEMTPLLSRSSEQGRDSEIANPYLCTTAPDKRYEYLLHSFKKSQFLWILGNETEGLTLSTNEEKALLIWPEAVYADAFAEQIQSDLKPICLTWDEVVDLGNRNLSDPKAGFFVFATQKNGYLVSADKFLNDFTKI